MKRLLLLLFFLLSSIPCTAKEVLVFGAISTVKPKLMKEHLQPLLKHLELVTGKEVCFQTGRDYHDTIDKFVDGTFDFGYIGPTPYILATRQDPDALRIVAGLESNETPYFHSVIVTRKTSPIQTVNTLKGKRFAFGSSNSTLSYYLPMHMLMETDVDKKLERYDFLGRHDKVAQYVIMGKYDAGGLKESVAKKYGKYLKIIATSEPIYDFLIVTHASMDPELFKKIQDALLGCCKSAILKSIKSSATGFSKRNDSDYDNLRKIMHEVDARAH